MILICSVVLGQVNPVLPIEPDPSGGPQPTIESEPAPVAPRRWSYAVSATIKGSFDSNVYLQSLTPLANESSLVTAVGGDLKGTWKSADTINVSLAYRPELVFYHSESSEDHVNHRALLDLRAALGASLIEFGNQLHWIDGSRVGPTWTGPGGAPAAGGPGVRDRRQAAVWRSRLSWTQALESWFVRPLATVYLHDFHTEHRATAGYQNYVDRNEVTAGLDLGRRLSDTWSASLGYRFGQQRQAQLLDFPERYNNTFHRVLAGVEGNIATRVKLNLTIGPEFRRYGNHVPIAFGDHDRLNLFFDATAVLRPTDRDTFTLSARQFQQPGFSGRAAYDDLLAELAWRHRLSQTWTIGVGGRAYNTDFLAPVIRDDWIFSANALLNWAVAPRLNAECSYQFEDGQTRDWNAAGRTYARHLVALGLRYDYR
jgi:hypothetical protein